MKLNRKQNGFTLTPALLILVLLMVAGVTYLIFVRSIGTTERKVEAAQIAKYAAETGIYQVKAQLGKNTNKTQSAWYLMKNHDGTSCIFASSASDEASRNELNTSKSSGFIDLKEVINNPDSKIIGKYKITIEDGRFVNGNKTITGNLTEGIDKYNNRIWSSPSDWSSQSAWQSSRFKNYFPKLGVYRFGVRVDGYAEDNRSQSLYAVIDVPQNSGAISPAEWIDKTPASYLLATNGRDKDNYAESLNIYSNGIITGPIHSNTQLGFIWRGNFDDIFSSRTTRARINLNQTVTATRFTGANTADPPPPLISKIFRGPNNTIIIHGMNFSSVKTPVKNSNNHFIAGNLVTFPNNKAGVIKKAEPNRLEVEIPSGAQDGYLSLGVYESSATTNSNIELSTLEEENPNQNNSFEVLGVMNVIGSNGRVYRQGEDYRLLLYDNPGTTDVEKIPYIVWDPNGHEPNTATTYQVTFITPKNIPQRLISIYDKVSYSGAAPKFSYIHSHKAPGTTSYRWIGDHNHNGSIFGMAGINLATALNPTHYYFGNWQSFTYDWDFFHEHQIVGPLLTGTFSKDYFFMWDSLAYKPLAPVSAKTAPILKPNNFNFNTQREYANQVFKIILNKSLKNDTGQMIDPATIPEDLENGYFDATKRNGVVDFRATYFGNDLKYNAGSKSGQYVLPAGSKISETKTIYVNERMYLNDNPLTPNSNYMKISDSVGIGTDANDFKAYTYRQIPKNSPILIKNKDNELVDIEGGIIFVREGAVRIGGVQYKSNPRLGLSAYVDNPVGGKFVKGKNTIIDGRLTIISYSEKKPTTYIDNNKNSTSDNPGDIVITGNVIYKNKLYKYQDLNEIKNNRPTRKFTYDRSTRQYPYYSGTPLAIDDDSIQWITDEDGKLERNLPANIKLNSLGLIASNDIKIPITHYYQEEDEDTFETDKENPSDYLNEKEDILYIHGQLIAGNQITQTKAGSDNKAFSKNDQLIMFGSYFSYLPPNFSYFDREDPNNPQEESIGRLYLFDKTPEQIPLGGAPSFPVEGDYTEGNQFVAGLNLPRIVPGTWKLVTDGS